MVVASPRRMPKALHAWLWSSLAASVAGEMPLHSVVSLRDRYPEVLLLLFANLFVAASVVRCFLPPVTGMMRKAVRMWSWLSLWPFLALQLPVRPVHAFRGDYPGVFLLLCVNFLIATGAAFCFDARREDARLRRADGSPV